MTETGYDPVQGCIHCGRMPCTFLHWVEWKGQQFLLQTCWDCAGRYTRTQRRQALREAKKRYVAALAAQRTC